MSLGLVYAAEVRDGHARVVMTLTGPACPLGEVLTREARAAILARVPGVVSAAVELTWDPPWQPSMMSAAARERLGGP